MFKKIMMGSIPYVILFGNILVNYIRKKLALSAFSVMEIYCITTLIYYLLTGVMLSIYITYVSEQTNYCQKMICSNAILLIIILTVSFLIPTTYIYHYDFSYTNILLIGMHLHGVLYSKRVSYSNKQRKGEESNEKIN